MKAWEHRALLLPEDDSEGLREISLSPREAFMPFALLLWGPRPDTIIRRLRVEGVDQIGRTLPGSDFESDVSHQEFVNLLSPGLHDPMPAVMSLRELGHFERWPLSGVSVGGIIDLLIEGRFDHGAFIGRVPT